MSHMWCPKRKKHRQQHEAGRCKGKCGVRRKTRVSRFWCPKISRADFVLKAVVSEKYEMILANVHSHFVSHFVRHFGHHLFSLGMFFPLAALGGFSKGPRRLFATTIQHNNYVRKALGVRHAEAHENRRSTLHKSKDENGTPP